MTSDAPETEHNCAARKALATFLLWFGLMIGVVIIAWTAAAFLMGMALID